MGGAQIYERFLEKYIYLNCCQNIKYFHALPVKGILARCQGYHFLINHIRCPRAFNTLNVTNIFEGLNSVNRIVRASPKQLNFST